MKKLIVFIIAAVSLTLYLTNQGEKNPETTEEVVEQNESFLDDNLVPDKTKNKVISHREKVLEEAIGKKLSKNDSFKKLIENDKKDQLGKDDIIKDKAFVKKTFEKLYDCHKSGCGEKPDHDGYFNAGQTAAIESINQILELNLLEENNEVPAWLDQNKLFDLLKVENPKTRSLSLAHLLKKSSDPQVREALSNEIKKLDGQNFSDAVIGVAEYDDYIDSSAIIELLTAGFQSTNNHAVIESIYGLNTKMQIDENQFREVTAELCPRVLDINAKKPISNGMNKWAENSNINLKIEDVCNQ